MQGVLSNINPTGSASLPYIPQMNGGGGGQNAFNGKNGGTSSSSGGFTLLQGHIQLMAMVPNLPENALSPRSRSLQEMGQHETREGLSESPSITPRLMPSASRFKKSHLPSRSGHHHHHHHNHSRHHPSHQQSWHSSTSSHPTASNLSLPPKPSKPVAMPSFGRQLPGTKKMVESGMFQYSSSSVQQQSPPPNNFVYESAQLPPQPAMIHPHHPHQQQQAYLNHYATGGPAPCQYPPQYPNMAYQMTNLASQQRQQQQYEYIMRSNAGGSGDYHQHPNKQMAQMLFQFQQQQYHHPHHQPQPQPFHPTYEMPYANYTGNERQYGPQIPGYQYGQSPPYQHPQQPLQYPHHPMTSSPSPAGASPPCAVQSLPCFGAQYGQQPRPGLIPSPLYSTSMPQININGSPSQSPSPLANLESQNLSLDPLSQLPQVNLPDAAVKSCKSRSKIKQEVSILVEDSSDDDDDCSCSDDDDDTKLKSICEKYRKSSRKSSKHQIMNDEPLSTMESPRTDPEEPPPPHHHHLHSRYPVDDHMLGPDSVPIRVSNSKSKILHSPTRGGERVCKGNEFCSNCTRCLNKLKPPSAECENQFTIKTKKKKSKTNNPNPKKQQKPEVVSLHDCFPSDSSITPQEEEDSDLLETPRQSSLINQPCKSALKKRKPKLETILHKSSRVLKCGEPSKVFEVLHDLNPDEVRLFTADYIVELLSSADWSNCHLGLETMVRLARHRPKILLNFMGPILWYAFRHLTSAKSALCRAAIVTFTELFERVGAALDNDLEKLTEKLVIKSLAPNKFIQEECDKALEAMIKNCSLVKVLGAMEGVSRKGTIKAASHRVAVMTKEFIKVAGVDTCLKPMYAEKLLPMLFSFMTEANIQTRTAAKDALGMLMNHLQFEVAVTKHVTFDRNCTEVFKKLDKMRGRNKNRAYPTGH